MNKQIREFEKLAMSVVMNGKDPDGDVDEMYIPAEFTKTFAELVVRECARIAIREDHDPADCILSHFGFDPRK